MSKRTIGVFTGSRADYGLLAWLMREIAKDEDLKLKVIVSGAHLDPGFGHTYQDVEDDGFTIDAGIKISVKGDTPSFVTFAMGECLSGLAGVCENLSLDLIVVLGDRYETLLMAIAATMARCPIAHIHGGELTHGAVDDAFRHAISKMSHLHFVAAEAYKKRLIQLGENPASIFTFGAPGLDNIAKLPLLDREEFAAQVGFDPLDDYFVVTYHPETRGSVDPKICIKSILEALEVLPKYKIIFTGVNADPTFSQVSKPIFEFVERYKNRVVFFQSMGQINYLSALKNCAVVIGNSSSGMIEAPAMGIPTVNIGSRQSGRIKAPSVIDSDYDVKAIISSIKKATKPEFRESISCVKKPSGEVSRNIKNQIKNAHLKNILQKKFIDL